MSNKKRDLGLLPDEILLRVLSFLNAKQAVQSTLISKRWVNLWTSLPDLNFISSDFQNAPSFDNFVDNVLTLRRELALVKSLNFSRKDLVKLEFLKRVVSYAINHGAEHLGIAIEHIEGCDDSCLLSSPNTLLTLKICVPGIMMTSNGSCFEKLVTLHIERAGLVQSDAFSGCPNLENLTLINCQMVAGLNVLVLSGTRLLKLTITSRSRALRCGELVLFSSRLTFLDIKGIFPLPISLRGNDGLLHLNEICFDSSDTSDLENSCKQKLHSYLTKMLRLFQKAKYVTLSTNTVEILGCDPDMSAHEQFHFCDLKSLTLVSSIHQWHKTFKLPLYVMDYFSLSSPQAEINIELISEGLIDSDDQEDDQGN